VSEPVLSVVTPVFNSARFLPDALDSVASLETPHEHIVIDGGSTDGTQDLLAARDVTWVSEPDRGQTDAVNKGLRRAQGELVGWLNGDDSYLSANVDRAARHLLDHPELDAVYGGLQIVNEAGALKRDFRPAAWSWRRYLFFGDNVPTPTILFRRRLLERAGLLDERWADAADYDFYLRLFRGARVERLAVPLVRFRYHADSKTYRAAQVQLDEAMQIRLGYARNAAERAAMKGLDVVKRQVLLRLTPWQPERYTED
jgi:glycosyltransferase involved in cell wall biosynthesis